MLGSSRLVRSLAVAAVLLQLYSNSVPLAHAARIVVHPFPWTSHTFSLAAVTRELALRGHTVLFVAPRGLRSKIDGLIGADLLSSASGVARIEYEADTNALMKLAAANIFQMVGSLEEFLFNSCATVLSDESAMAALHDFDADLFVGDTLTSSWMMADVLGVPRVDFHVGVGGAAVEALVYGHSMPSLAYTPVYSSGLPPTGMNMPQRALNALLLGATRALTYALPYSSSAATRNGVNATWCNIRVPPPGRHRTVLTISAADMAVEQPRPVSPHMKLVGPVLATPPQPLPRRLQGFVAGAGEPGVILVAFGSVLSVPPRSLIALANALAAMPQRIVWKVEDADLDAATRREFRAIVSSAGNILVLPWLPQQDLLGHPAVVLYLTHGGIHSMYESLWHAKPMVVMPLALDQFDNARLISEYHQAGMTVDRLRLAKGDTSRLTAALYKVINEPSYKKRAQRISARLQAQPGTPRSRAVDWIEYALAAGPEPFLWAEDVHMSWIKLNFVDVAAAAAAVPAAAITLATWWLWRRRSVPTEFRPRRPRQPTSP